MSALELAYDTRGVRILSTDDQIGLIAVGQFATGFFAMGQVATGVIAIGQVARGVIAIGQASIGVITVGQITVGLAWGAGFGLAGRGRGLVGSLIPTLEPTYDYPPTTTYDHVKSGYGDGWIRATLHLAPDGAITLADPEGNNPYSLKLKNTLVPRARAEVQQYGPSPVVAHLRNVGTLVVCDRLMHVPKPMRNRPGFWAALTLRMAVLAGLAILVWVLAVRPALQIIFAL